MYPGDSDFSYANYPGQPYNYVLEAVSKGSALMQERLYMQERPIAQLTAMTANLNRDTKKQPKPYHFDDFCLYKDREGHDQPDTAYGSAAMALLKQKRMPPWALFCYKALSNAADPGYTPRLAGFVAEDAILLHPVKQSDGYTGMLIALESASEQPRVFLDDHGHQIALTVPHINTKVVAIENVTLES